MLFSYKQIRDGRIEIYNQSQLIQNNTIINISNKTIIVIKRQSEKIEWFFNKKNKGSGRISKEFVIVKWQSEEKKPSNRGAN